MSNEIKKSETSKSIFKNVLYGFSTWILPLGLSFAATPIIVKALGDENYGIYALVLGFVGYSFNFSIGRVITKYIAEYNAVGEKDKIKDLISAAFFLNLAVGLTGVCTIVFLAGWLVNDVFNIDPNSQTKSIYAFYIAAAILFVSILTQIFNSVLQGMHRFDIYSKIFNFNGITLIIGNIILALNGYGLLSLLLWNLMISSISCIFYAISAKKILPEFGLKLSFPRSVFKLVFAFSSGVVGYQVLSNLVLLFERGWITRKLGTETLTYYVVPMALSLYLHGFISSLLLVLFPLVSELQNDKEKLLRLYTKATKIVCLLVVFIAITLIIQSRELLTLWMSPDFAVRSHYLLIIHTVSYGLLAIQSVAWQMTEGLGHPNFNFKMIAVYLVVCVVLMILLIDNYGEFGVAIARMTGSIVIFPTVFYVEKWFLGKVQYRLWLKILGTLAASGVLCVLIQIFIKNNLPLTWFTYIFSVFCGGIGYCACVWLLGYIAEDEKVLFRSLIKRGT